LRVAQLTLAATAENRTRALDPPAAALPFLVDRGGDIRLELSDAPPPEAHAGSLLFRSGGVWSVHSHGRGLLYSFRSPAARPPVYKVVVIDRGLREGRLHFPRGNGPRPQYALDFPLDELLFQHRWVREGAIEVHACGIVEAGRCLLFCGVSGAGKSTTARLWARHRPRSFALSDDRIVLRPWKDRFRAHGTPWHGEGGFASPSSAPLEALFFLKKGRRSRARPLSAPEATARLLARSFPPPWDGEAMARALATCAAVALSVPAYELSFVRDHTAVSAALER
jgi:hypothetical protein